MTISNVVSYSGLKVYPEIKHTNLVIRLPIFRHCSTSKQCVIRSERFEGSISIFTNFIYFYEVCKSWLCTICHAFSLTYAHMHTYITHPPIHTHVNIHQHTYIYIIYIIFHDMTYVIYLYMFLFFQTLYSICSKLEDHKADKDFVQSEVDVVNISLF